MKRLAFFLVIALCGTAFSSKEKANELRWHAVNKLAWEDFQGSVSEYSSGDAATMVTIRAVPFRKNRKLRYKVETIFHRDKSWCKSPSKNLLAHEQLHFDLAELYARKVRKKIAEYQRAGLRDIQVYNKAIHKILEESNQADVEYDRITLHGALSKKQALWNERVRIELAILGNYATNY